MHPEIESAVAELDRKLLALGDPHPPSEPWGDTPEKRDLRAKWPEFREGTDDELQAVGALLPAKDGSDAARWASGRGVLRFCTSREGVPSFVLLSHCGGAAYKWKLDGTPWNVPGEGFPEMRTLPGSIPVPLGMDTLAAPIRSVAVFPVKDYLPILLHAYRTFRDVALIGVPGESLHRDFLKEMRPKHRVRVFPANAFFQERMRAEKWRVEILLTGARAGVFDFRADGCIDAKGFIARYPKGIPKECETMIREGEAFYA